MAILRCADYGFKCRFATKGEEPSVVEDFGKHTKTKHGIEYSEETITQFIMRKRD